MVCVIQWSRLTPERVCGLRSGSALSDCSLTLAMSAGLCVEGAVAGADMNLALGLFAPICARHIASPLPGPLWRSLHVCIALSDINVAARVACAWANARVFGTAKDKGSVISVADEGGP